MDTSESEGKSFGEFRPLDRILLPGGEAIEAKGLILIVGPNSSGKTQLLKDIQASLLEQPRKLVVAKNVRVRKHPSFNALIDSLEAEGYIRLELNDSGRKVIRVRTVPLGGSSPELPRELDVESARGWYNGFEEGKPNGSSRSFLSFFGSLMCSAMFLANRLTATNQTGNYDFEKEAPKNDLQALYFNSKATEELTKEVRETFGIGIWIDPLRGNTLCFRVTNSPDLPSDADLRKPDRVTQYRVIDEEGDGLRSFVAICMVLALSRRPVCLIDEPETCLHPPQAYSLGRIIGRQATKQSATTLVATHSSHVLRGVIQETRESQDVQIVRLTRVAGVFHAHLVDSDLLRKATAKPLVRTEAIFDGIFADGVVLVESDGDRAVYQAMWELSEKETQLDLLFVPVNGKGPMADIAAFFKTLRIPVAIIPDLDLIRDDGVIAKLLTAMSAESSVASAISQECRIVAEAVRSIPPTIAPAEVNSQIQQIKDDPKVWENNDDETVMNKLRALAQKIDRMRKLKAGGIEAYKAAHPGIASKLETVKDKFWKVGIFIVPVGELEWWFSDEFMKDGPSRERKKQEWADEAALRLRQRPNEAGPIREFVAAVSRYIAKRESELEHSGD